MSEQRFYVIGRQVVPSDGRVLFSYLRTCPRCNTVTPQSTKAVEEDGHQLEIEVCLVCKTIRRVDAL